MPNPLFPVTAAARLDITVGAASRAAYFTLVAQYQFGTPVIQGVAPQALASQIGVPLYSQIVDPGLVATIPGVVVVSFPYATPSVVVGGVAYPVDVTLGGGTLVGVNYVDPNGVLYPDVDWTWAISVEAYLNGASGTLGTFDLQVVTWTGDGTAGRLIPTTFDLTQGQVAVWVFPQTSGQSSFRYRGMPGTALVQAPVSTTGGIMTFTASGFTVTDDAPSSVFVNFNTIKFTALVLRDTTTDNRYMRVGTYLGWPAVNGLFTANADGTMTLAGGGGVGAQNVGQAIAFTGGINPASWNGVITAVTDATHFVASGTPANNTNYTGITTVAARTLAPGGTRALTQVWVFGRASQAAFGSDDFTAPNSVSFGVEAKALTTQITALLGAQFSIGTDNNVNGNALPYYYLAFAIPVGSAIRTLFRTFTVTGTGGVVQVTGLGFTPQFATAREFVSGTPVSAWRSPWHAGTTSTEFDLTALASGGIQAFGNGTLDLGGTVAPNSTAVYGFAVAASGSVSTPVDPVYTLVPAPPYTPPGGPPGGPLSPGPSAGGVGCASTVAVGVGGLPGSVGCAADLSSGTGAASGSTGCAR